MADCQSHRSIRTTNTVAEGQPPLTLIVDGLGFLHILFEKASCPEEWEWILGGNYAVLAAALESYALRRRQGCVEIVVVFDTAHGTATVAEEEDRTNDENPDGMIP